MTTASQRSGNRDLRNTGHLLNLGPNREHIGRPKTLPRCVIATAVVFFITAEDVQSCADDMKVQNEGNIDGFRRLEYNRPRGVPIRRQNSQKSGDMFDELFVRVPGRLLKLKE
jgi:hypothetical protein